MTKAPNLIIAGFQKCGSTFLARTLGAHPAIQVATGKEPNIFLKSNENDYERFFDHAFPSPESAFRCDASINYIVSEGARHRAARWCPADTRTIVIVRDPVARTLSGYLHMKKRFGEHRSIRDVLGPLSKDPHEIRTSEITSTLAALQHGKLDLFKKIDAHDERWINALYVSNSLYHFHIQNWKQAFGDRKIMVVLFEDLVTKLDETLSHIANFLGIDGLEGSMAPNAASNRTVLPPFLSVEGSVGRFTKLVSNGALRFGISTPLQSNSSDFSQSVRDQIYAFTKPASQALFDDLGIDWTSSAWNHEI